MLQTKDAWRDDYSSPTPYQVKTLPLSAKLPSWRLPAPAIWTLTLTLTLVSQLAYDAILSLLPQVRGAASTASPR